jgi:uncharacterized membrane protein YhaH (DUF805 family)
MFAWYMDVLRKYAVFSGRAGRPEFWWFTLANIIVSLAIEIVIGLLIGRGLGQGLASLYSLAVLLPSIGVAIRRLHDTNRSGWWILIGFVPIIGWIVLIVFYASQGSATENNYGDLPPAQPAAA